MINIEFVNKNIDQSRNDYKINISLPTLLTTELAEFIGIMIGDGHIGIYRGIDGKGRKYVDYQIKISVNEKERQYTRHLKKLFNLMFGVEFHYDSDPRSNRGILRRNSKGLANFLNQQCEIPVNKKHDFVGVPNIIKKSGHKKNMCISSWPSRHRF